MSRDLPYFKFIATEWMTGNIIYEPFEVQGLFINICALYWNRGGILSEVEMVQRYKKKSLIAKLSGRFFSVSDGFIKIDFLDEQLNERQRLSEINSRNGKKGGRGHSLENKANAKRNESEIKANESNIEKEKEEDKEKEIEIEEEAKFQIGDFFTNDLKKFLETKFQILMNDLKKKYGELIFYEAVKEFEERNLQKHWKDEQDIRQHFTNYLRIHSENKKKNGTATKSLSTTIQVNEGKSFGGFRRQ